jgi:hypothetical protein
MADAILYTIERQGAGLMRTNLARVKGATLLKVDNGNQAVAHPLHGLRQSTAIASKGHLTGVVHLRLEIGDSEIDLATCKGAVALVVTSRNHPDLFWIENGQCTDVAQPANFSEAVARIEAKHCTECELPPLQATP